MQGFLAAALAAALMAADPPSELPLDAADFAVRRPGAPPLRVRLRIAVEGMPFRHAWKRHFEDLWKRLDRDRSGALDDAEKLGLPWPAPAGPLAPDAFWKLAAERTPALRLEDAPPRRRSASGAFALLDANDDGALDPAELKAAAALLERRDFDDDGLLAPEELLAGPGAVAARKPVALLPYDGSRPAEWPSLPAAPDVTLWFELGQNRSREVPPPEVAPHAKLKASVTRAHAFLDAGDLRIDASAKPDAVVNPFGGLPAFATLDADENGYLSATELKEALPAGSFGLLDLDQDGKVSEREYSDFVVRRKKFLALTVALRSADEGREAFGPLDADGDGRLSRRELAEAPKTLGGAGAARFQRALTWELFRGDASPRLAMAAPPAGRAAGPRPPEGPAWHQAMDLNRDGAVDAREFLGPPPRFRELDRDRDGLLSPAEAAGK